MPWQFLKQAIGLTEGGQLRAVIDQVKESFGRDHGPAQSRVAFTIAVVTLAAKMSKADGVSSPVEAEAFKQQFSVPESECVNVRRLYELAAQDITGFEYYARQIGAMLDDEPDLKMSVLESLFHVASADGVLHPDEDAYLAEVSGLFGLTAADYRSVRRAFIHDPDGPYEILGVRANASDAEIKARYRDLVKSHHPDALISKGVPPELLAGAGRRLAAITTAYDAILAERGTRVARALEPSP
jgi:DnaJ like chaperone protein